MDQGVDRLIAWLRQTVKDRPVVTVTRDSRILGESERTIELRAGEARGYESRERLIKPLRAAGIPGKVP